MLVIVGGGLREGFLRSPTMDSHTSNEDSIQNKPIEFVTFACHYSFDAPGGFSEY